MMQRQRIVSSVLLAAAIGFSLPAAAQQWVEGTHYQRLPDAPAHVEGQPIEVTEIFWYGCPACFQFEPLVERWLQTRPVDVEFQRIGASLNQSWRLHARAYYTAEVLGVVEQVHREMFRAIHVNQNPLNDTASIARVFQQHAGVTQADFMRAFESFGVETRSRRGDQLTRRYRVNATPTVVVAGTFSFSPASAGTYDAAIRLLDHLLEQVRGAPNVPVEPGTPIRARTETPVTAGAAQAEAEPEPDAPGVPLWAYLVGGVVAVGALLLIMGARRS